MKDHLQSVPLTEEEVVERATALANEVVRDNRIFDFAWGDNPEGLRVVLVEKFSGLLRLPKAEMKEKISKLFQEAKNLQWGSATAALTYVEQRISMFAPPTREEIVNIIDPLAADHKEDMPVTYEELGAKADAILALFNPVAKQEERG